MLYLLQDKQCIQQITRPKMGKKTQAGVQHLLSQKYDIISHCDTYDVTLNRDVTNTEVFNCLVQKQHSRNVTRHIVELVDWFLMARQQRKVNFCKSERMEMYNKIILISYTKATIS